MSKKQNPPPPYGGIINLGKPVGPTSLQMVSRIKRASGIRKIGHCGTLDPFADGVLPIAVGRATNMVQFMDDYDKVYRVLIHLGEATATGDLTGEVIRRKWPKPEQCDRWAEADGRLLRQAIASLTGKIVQQTPVFSAAKIDGKPMYEYARAGQSVEGKLRQVEIYCAELVAYGRYDNSGEMLTMDRLAGTEFFPGTLREEGGLDQIQSVSEPVFWLIADVHCSKGTYIRVWAEDLGKALGTEAYAARLRRLRSGPYQLEDSVTIQEVRAYLEAGGQFEFPEGEDTPLCDASTARPDLPVIELARQEAIRILQGKSVSLTLAPTAFGLCRLFSEQQFLGLGRCHKSEEGASLVAERMFRSLEIFTS